MWLLSGLKSVARASSESLLKMWEGLGYYARVKNFHSASNVVMNKFDGKIPDNYRGFQSLPGVGPYISGAIISIAFNHIRIY